MAFINGLAWVVAVIGWILGLFLLYCDWEEVNGKHAELKAALQGGYYRYNWELFIVAAIVATVWLVTM